MPRAKSYKALETALGFRFKRRTLLEQALTHASVRGGKGPRFDNERLEFLGDRVLGLAIAELLVAALPEATEGQLARHYNRLVRGGTCAAVARDIGVGQHVILSESEAESGGRDKDTILADAIEALLGAAFLEGGFDAGRQVVRKLWAPYVEDIPAVTADAKSLLQEWAQGQGLPLPEYVEVARKGPDHAPHFTAEVRIPGRPAARGEGASKRAAEQAAARVALSREGVESAS